MVAQLLSLKLKGKHPHNKRKLHGKRVELYITKKTKKYKQFNKLKTNNNTTKVDMMLDAKSKQKQEQSGGHKVTTLDDIDYDQLKVSKHVKINWGNLPDGPPTNCCIL